MGLILLKAQWMGTNQDFQINSLLSTVNVSGWKPLLRPRRAKAIEVAQLSSLKCNLALKLEEQFLASQALDQHMPDQKNLTEITSVGIFGSGSIFRTRALTFNLTSIISKQPADKSAKSGSYSKKHFSLGKGWNSTFFRLPSSCQILRVFLSLVTSTVLGAVISTQWCHLTACSWAALGQMWYHSLVSDGGTV